MTLLSLQSPVCREVFGRMGMNDTETVALIGGGHTTGKSHGACPAGAGPGPAEQPGDPWPGLCGEAGAGRGRGNNTATSGIELPFTSRPTVWDTEYFNNLRNYHWTKVRGPGGHWQWAPSPQPGTDGEIPRAPTAHDKTKTEPVGLLTTDVALMFDPKYRKLVKRFAEDREYFDHQFAHAWYKLTTRDMGPRSRCSNDDAPPSQPWQHPLPERSRPLPDFREVKRNILAVLRQEERALGLFARLAWQCASTFRSTNYRGGCNGARILFPPGRDWEVNTNLGPALNLLQPIMRRFQPALSWSDLIILAGTSALELGAGPGTSIPFCSVGRVDVTAADLGWKHLKPRIR